MKGVKLSVTLLLFGLFLFAPSIPNAVLTVTVGTMVGVVVILLGTLAALRVDPVLGLAAFLAAGALFLENRKRIVTKLQGTKAAVAASLSSETLNSVENVTTPATDLIENEVHPSHESPFQEEHGFEPSEGMGSNTYSSVGGSIDTKAALASGTPTSAGTAAEGFRKAGLL